MEYNKKLEDRHYVFIPAEKIQVDKKPDTNNEGALLTEEVRVAASIRQLTVVLYCVAQYCIY